MICTKGLIIRVSAMFIVVIALCAAFLYLNSITKPEAVAKACYIDMVNGKFADAYDKLFIPEDQMTISKEDYVKQWEENGKLDFSNIKVVKVTDDKADKSKKKVTISYYNKEAKKEETQDVPMIRVEGKKFLFFDKWMLGS
jgi:hypothetical protein